MPVVNGFMMVASVSSGHTAMAPVDVCKTPTPAGPVPIPYPNISMSAMMGPGWPTKTLVLGTPPWTKKGKTSLSNGDEAGVAGGVMSSRNMGMCELMMASMDCKIEGGEVARTLDMTDGNG